MKTCAEWGFKLGGLGAALFFAFQMYADIPEIHRSWATQKCVRVVSTDPKHTCQNLPDRAETVWVE